MRRASPLGLVFVLLASCSDPAPATPDASVTATLPSPAEPGCNPVGYAGSCMLPFPASVFQGATLQLPMEHLPVSSGHLSNGDTPVPLDPAPWNRLDGFSPSSPLLAYLGARIDPASLNGPAAIAQTLTAMSSTVLVDMTTGERVAHFAEVDATVRADHPDDVQPVILRPAARLAPGRRYAVAITDAARTTAGRAPLRSAGFAALVNHSTQGNAALGPLAARYDQVFAALERAGVPTSRLVLAWDFTTATEQHLTGPVVAMRDQALAMVGETGMGFTVTQVENDYNANILRKVSGTFQVPRFLSDPASDTGRIVRGANGLPVVQGVYNVNFVAMIPRSAMTRGPLPLLHFGHGLFGSGSGELGAATATGNYMQRFINDQGFVVVATDWSGLSQADNLTAGLGLSNFNYLPTITDRLQQALVNAMVLWRTARGRFATHEAFAVDGRAVLDPTRAYYYGISLGGIMGTSLLGYSPDIARGVVNVAGGNWGLLLQRSSNFRAFEFAFADYDRRDDRQLLLALAQSLFDTSDPINVAPHLLRDRLPNVPEKRVLYQYAVDDAQVNNLASESVLRTMQMPLLGPPARTPFGLTVVTGPQDSAVSVWDEHPMPAPPGTNVPSPSNGTHNSARDITALKEQIRRFLQPAGRVEQTCDGPCDPQ